MIYSFSGKILLTILEVPLRHLIDSTTKAGQTSSAEVVHLILNTGIFSWIQEVNTGEL